MYDRPIVPVEFSVPERLGTAGFILRPLTVHDVILDHYAVMSSATELKGRMQDGSSWPEGLTLEDNLIDPGWHQREVTIRHSLACTVLSHDGERCLGCCYICPSSDPTFGAAACY